MLFKSLSAGMSLNTWFTDLKGENSGHTTCQFLNLPVSSVQLNRGIASMVASMDATDLPFYPASSALANRNKFAFTHLEWMMGLRKEYAGALFPLRDVGTTIGVYSQVFTPGSFDNARDIEENRSKPDMLEFAGGLTVASSFLKKTLSVGAGLTLIQSRIDDCTAGAVSFSGNILYTPLKALSLQCNAANFGTDIKYVNTRESLPARAGLSLRIAPIPEHVLFTSKFNFDIAAGVAKIADEPLICGVSTEITLLNLIKVRAGYDYIYGVKPDLCGFSAGAGFHYGMYGFDGSWKNQSNDLGSVWATTLKLQLNEIEPRTAEDFYQSALKQYNRNRMKMSTLFAHKALQLDPSMWKAHSLLTMIRSQQLRQKNLEIGLVYTGNIKSSFTVPFEPLTFGGLSRIVSTVNSVRSRFNVCFTLETGNLITQLSHPDRIKLAVNALDYAHFDAVAAGKNELILGPEPFDKAGMKQIKFISSSIDNNSYIDHQIVEYNGYKIFVASITGITALPPALKKSYKSFKEDEVLSGNSSACQLRILVVDDTWENIRLLAARLRQFDLIICNNLDQQFASPVLIGKVKILSTGSQGNYVGFLTLRFNDSKQLVSLENRLIPMNSDITPDPHIDSLVRAISAEIELSKQGIDSIAMTRTSTDGSFIFLSDRDSSTGIFLKSNPQLAEFPLSRSTGTDCGHPAYSFSRGKVFFSQKTGSCQQLVTMDITGALKHIVKDSVIISDITFSPDGQWAYISMGDCKKTKTDIYRMRYDGGKLIPVITWNESSEYDVNVSSDNTTIAYCSDRDESPQIYVSGIDGSQPVRITDSSAQYSKPLYGPSKKYLAYLSDIGNFSGRMDLWIYDLTTGVRRQITSNSNVKDYCWLSDGITIVYSSGVNILDLNKVDIESIRFSKLVADTGLKTANDYNPHSLFVNGQENVIFTREEIDGSKKIMMVHANGADCIPVVDGKGNDWLP